MNTQYIGNLTPLRGIAALFIVIFHIDATFFGGNITGAWHTSLISHSYIMVDFFFMLSGFIMFHVYGNRFANGVSWDNFKTFTISRFARIYPLHLFTLLFLIALVTTYRLTAGPIPNPLIDAIYANKNILANILLVQGMNLTDFISWNVVAWSISTEWWAYMLFPLLAMTFPKPGNNAARILIFISCLATYLIIVYILSPKVTYPESLSFLNDQPKNHTINVTYQYGFLRCMAGFLIGMLSYQIYKDNKAKNIFSSNIVLLSFTLGLFLCMHFDVADIISICFFPFIILCTAYGNTHLNNLFSSMPMQNLGDWSFSIYMLQLLVVTITYIALPDLSIFETHGLPPLNTPLVTISFCLVLVGIIVFLSSLSYRWIELPARKFINRL